MELTINSQTNKAKKNDENKTILSQNVIKFIEKKPTKWRG